MFYQEYLPHPALRGHVACLWLAHAPAQPTPHTHRVLPDNCIDILWQDSGAPAFAVGMMTRAIHVTAERAVRTVAVRFKPGAAGPFLAQAGLQSGLLAPPLHELADQRTDLDLLWGRSDANRLADALWADGLDDAGRLRLLERQLLARLPGPGITPLIAAALHAIDGSGGTLRIETLAGALGVSRQHLAAQFRAKVGLTPKMYARICRFRRATGALAAAPARAAATDWAGLALDCGYFDQSHLIHDFQEFAGAAPESFLR